MDKAGVGNKIMGEIYEVDGKMLGKLDELEDHPRYGDILADADNDLIMQVLREETGASH
jgi:gamma-glutamylcyclotransferase (GGCT)/AIG2-like uncharacterized protein YtfP